MSIAHLFLNIIQRIGTVNGKTYKNDVRVGVTYRTEAIVVLCATRIPDGQFHMFPVHLDVSDVILKDGSLW